MSRNLYIVAALALAGPSFSAFGLGLGDIHTKSALNQKFDAQIELHSVPVGELDMVHVTLASAEAFEKAGLDRSALLLDLKYSPVRLDNKKAVVQVTSNRIIREPFLNFLIEVHWPDGRMIKEYTVLLDPPVILDRRQPKVAGSEVTVSSPARNQEPVSPPAGVVKATSADRRYGPVKSGETLSKIAVRVRDKNASIEQTMIALWKANPDAFINNNINLLKKGQTLRVPDFDETVQLNRKSARNEYQRQIGEWKTAGSVAGSATVKPPEEEKVEESSPASAVKKEAGQGDSRLRLITQSYTGNTAAGSDESLTIPELQNQLVLTKEEAERYRLESESLKSRVNELVAQLENIRQHIAVKGDLSDQDKSQTEIDATSVENEDETAVADKADAEISSKQMTVSEGENGSNTSEQVFTDDALTGVAASEDVLPEQDSKGLLNILVDNVILIAGFFALGIFALIRIVRRKNRASRESGEDSLLYGSLEKGQLEEMPGNDAANLELSNAEQVADEANLVDAAEVALAEEAAEAAAAAEAEAAAKEKAEAEAAAKADDELISKADAYIEQGKYERAEEMLKQSLDKNPEKTRIRYKLMDVYYAMRNVEAFNEMIVSIVSAGEEDLDSGAWTRAMEMSMELAGDGESIPGSENTMSDSTDSIDPNWLFDDIDAVEDSANDIEETADEDKDLEFKVVKSNQR